MTIGRRAALVGAAGALPVLAALFQLAAIEVGRLAPPADPWLGWADGGAATWWALALVAIEAASFALWMLVLGELPLAIAFPLTAIGSILSLWLVSWALALAVPAAAWIGTIAILAGSWLIVRPGR